MRETSLCILVGLNILPVKGNILQILLIDRIQRYNAKVVYSLIIRMEYAACLLNMDNHVSR